MNRRLARLFSLALGAVILAAAARSSRPGPLMAEAAGKFLAALTQEQRARALFPFDADERLNWHFIPKPRRGLSFKEMDEPQRELARAFLRAGLSQQGYLKATTIMSLEEVLHALEGGRGPIRDPELYFFTVFGQPSEKETWGWRVEGHHLSLNFTVVQGRLIASTPQFFGANPAEVREGPRRGLRVLHAEEDLARELLNSLTPAQRARAVIAERAPGEIITGASRKAEIAEAKGLPAGEMTEKQRATFTALLRAYVEAMPQTIADERLARLRQAGMEKIRFAWAGGAERGQPHYYRLQGPTFLVEYDNTQNNANHIHTVWRDFHGDFGEDLLREHYRAYHQPTGAGR
jgi:Protein of unknown function (DUF3500)